MQASLFTSNSNTARLFRLATFAIVLIVSVWIAGGIYEGVSKKNIIGQHVVTRFNEFYSLQQDSLDMVFVGSSHSYTTFDPEVFDSRLGTSSFQMGAPSQQADSTYYELREIFNYQKPKLVVYEYYWGVLGKEHESDQAKTLLSMLRTNSLRNEYAMKVFSVKEGDLAKYLIKTVRFQNDYFAYMSSLLASTVSELKNSISDAATQSKTAAASNANGEEYYRSKGFVYCDYEMPLAEYEEGNHFKWVDGEKWDFNDEQKNYVREIVELCRSQNAEIIFVSAPLANVTVEKHIKNYNLINEKMLSYAAELNVPFVDYNIVNQQEQLLVNSNFRDDNHLNYTGAVIVSNHFIEWLNEKNFLR